MFGKPELPTHNCSDCSNRLFGAIITKNGGNTENYMTMDEFTKWKDKLGWNNIVLTGNCMCMSRDSVSYDKEVLSNWHPTDDFVFKCSGYKCEDVKKENKEKKVK